ncbi:MAG: PilZ domain-containing protein [Acidobacteriota bacterium]
MSATVSAPAKSRELAGSVRGRCEVNGSARECRILNLSGEGAFVESFVPALKGSTVMLEFQLPNGDVVTTTGVVSHHEFKSGFDVVFTGLSSAGRNQINSFQLGS